jgi:hypothetical protein
MILRIKRTPKPSNVFRRSSMLLDAMISRCSDSRIVNFDKLYLNSTYLLPKLSIDNARPCSYNPTNHSSLSRGFPKFGVEVVVLCLCFQRSGVTSLLLSSVSS